MQSIVPVAVERITFDRQLVPCLLRDFYAGFVTAFVQLGLDTQTLLGRGVADQLDHYLTADQWPTSPVLRDMTEHPMLDLVPLAGAWREMTDPDRHVQFVGQLLSFDAPQTPSRAITAAAIGGDHQDIGVWIAPLAHFIPPASKPFDGELRGIVVHSDADPALVGRDIVDTIRRDFAQVGILDIVHAEPLGLAWRLPFTPVVLKSPISSFFVTIQPP